LRKQLEKDGFNTPGAERVDGQYRNLVKYFSAADKQAAENLAASVATDSQKFGRFPTLVR